MAFSVSKKRSKPSKKVEAERCCSYYQFLISFLSRIPAAIFLLLLIYLWSSSTTIISGNIVHVCVSSRKLNNLYCLSAGTHQNIHVPLPVLNHTAVQSTINSGVKQVAQDVRDDPDPVSGNRVDEDSKLQVAHAVKVVNVVLDDPSTTEQRVDIDEVEDANAVKFLNITQDDPNPVIRQENQTRDEEIAYAEKIVEEQLELHRSWKSEKNYPQCDGRRIYVYDLPSKFNKDLVGQCHDMVPWVDFCTYFENDALGQPLPKLGNRWYKTHQYSLEPIFHARVLKHQCRVHNESEAQLFYVPFYGGFDILRWHFKNVSTDVKDALSLELIKWLEKQPSWARNSGKDHVFVLGKISWDFRRRDDSPWGTRFLQLDQMQNPVKLLIERQPWHLNDIGIPHPTFFHPHSDDDILSWQQKIISSKRRNLISFAGAARPDQPDNIRSILINQCNSTDNGVCHYLDCRSGGCDEPESVIELFTESEFCLQPEGDSPTRKSVFDSLVCGCIPVVFSPFTAYYQYPWHLSEDRGKYCVFIDQEEVRQRKVNVVEKLMQISPRQREDMRSFIVYELLPGLVYADPNSELQKFQDAFSISINNLLERVSRMNEL